MKKIKTTRLRQNIVKKIPLLPLGALTIIVISGLYFTQQHEGQNASRRSTAEPVTAIPAGILTLRDIESLVMTNASDEIKTVSAIELGNEDGILVYKIQLSDGSMRHINALTGNETPHYSHDDTAKDNNESALPAGFVPGVGFATARDTALSNHSTGEIERIKLESEGGKAVYSIRFNDNHRVDVDAQSGQIVKVKQAKPERTHDIQPDAHARPDRSNSTSGRDRSNDAQTYRDNGSSRHHISDTPRHEDSNDNNSDESRRRKHSDQN